MPYAKKKIEKFSFQNYFTNFAEAIRQPSLLPAHTKDYSIKFIL